MEKQQGSLKPFFSLILSTKIPKLPLILGLAASIITPLIRKSQRRD